MTFLRRVSVWVFGDEGTVLMDPMTQALVVASSILITGTVLVSPLIADLATVFSVSETRAGWLVVGFTAAAAMTLPLVGAFADILGRKPVLVVGLVTFGLAGAAVGTVTWFEAAIAFRVLQGMGFAAAAPFILTLFGDLYSGSRETTVQGIRVSVNGVSNTLVPLLASSLFVFSWRYPFAIYLLAVPAAIWIQLAAPPLEAGNDWSLRTYFSKLTTFLNDAAIGLLMVSFLFRFIVFYGLLTYISVLVIREAGFTVVTVGLLLSVRGVIKTASSTQVGRLSQTIDASILALGGFALIAVATAIMGLFPTRTVLFAAMAVWSVGDGVLSPCQKSLVNQLSPPEYRSGMMSTALTFQNVGKVVGPLGLGFLIVVVGPGPAFTLLGIVGGGIGVAALGGMILLQRT